ncbi:hypothetical protein AMECASPLE_029295 [Ameca splendens]|uniref:Uncharacterized protein n=1 Tax=Ameca splendens TaxID=208324 RepID=A0ABV0XIQ0_9TELE
MSTFLLELKTQPPWLGGTITTFFAVSFCPVSKTPIFLTFINIHPVINILLLVFPLSFCLFRTILEKMGQQGKVTPLQAKKKWDNMKKKYKVCSELLMSHTNKKYF